jgi:predicted nucleic acid-binding protein
MTERWILNASPLIALAAVGQGALFSALASTVVVPHAVAEEVLAGPVEDRARQDLEAGRFTVITTPAPPAELLAWDLGAGETAVLSLAMAEPDSTAVLDDAAARRCARSFGIRLRGTLGVVILARQREVIPSAATVLHALRANGFRLDDRTAREALARTTGEAWPG